MTSSTLNYGKMQRPESKNIPKTQTDPVQAAIGAYRQWLTLVKPSGFGKLPDDPSQYEPYLWRTAAAEGLYNEAAALIKPLSGAINSGGNAMLEKILSSIRPEDGDASGLFLSALHNETSLEQLTFQGSPIYGKRPYKLLGYRLAPGKRLVIGNGFVLDIAAPFAKGEVINYSKSVKYLSPDAEGDLHINFGEVAYMGMSSKDGMFFNFGECPNLCGDATNCEAFNFGYANPMDAVGAGTIALDFGTRPRAPAPEEVDTLAFGGIHASFQSTGSFTGTTVRLTPTGRTVHKYKGQLEASPEAISLDDPANADLYAELASAAKRIVKPVRLMKASQSGKIELIRQMDLPGLRNAIAELAKRAENEHRA